MLERAGAAQKDKQIMAINKRLDNHEARIIAVENAVIGIDRIADTAEKIFGYLKKATPLVATAAVTSGLVSGKFGAFLAALFH